MFLVYLEHTITVYPKPVINIPLCFGFRLVASHLWAQADKRERVFCARRASDLCQSRPDPSVTTSATTTPNLPAEEFFRAVQPMRSLMCSASVK